MDAVVALEKIARNATATLDALEEHGPSADSAEALDVALQAIERVAYAGLGVDPRYRRFRPGSTAPEPPRSD
jgi:hypothetical protein